MLRQLKRPLVIESQKLSADGIITTQIKPWGTIDNIYLAFLKDGAPATRAAVLKAIKKLNLTVNGQTFVNCTPTALDNFTKSLGNDVYQQNSSNVFDLMIGAKLFQMPQDEDFFALGCSDIQTIQVQIDCAAAITDVTDVQIFVERRNVEQPLGAYIKILDYPQNVTSAGPLEVDNLPRESNTAYLSVMIDPADGVISTGKVSVDGSNVYDVTSKALDDAIVANRGYAPVDKTFNYMFADRSPRGFLAMSGVGEFRLETEFSTAPTGGRANLTAISIVNLPARMVTFANANSLG